MADVQIVRIPSRYRYVFADGNWVSFEIPAGVRQVDVCFEDTSGKAVLGYLAPGFVLSGAPAATDPKLFAWSWVYTGREFGARQFSAALAASHAVNVIVT